jgi:hypothetical protein
MEVVATRPKLGHREILVTPDAVHGALLMDRLRRSLALLQGRNRRICGRFCGGLGVVTVHIAEKREVAAITHV